METTPSTPTAAPISKGALWTGYVISCICILFLLFDALAKIFKESHSVSGTMSLGFPESAVRIIGVILLVATVLHIIQRTAIIGAVLITGYLGGALAIMMRAGQPFYFPIIFGVLVWLGLYLRDKRAKVLFQRY